MLVNDTISNDFIGCLLYPAVASIHAIVQVSHYPGSENELWSTEDALLVPYSMAIQASVKVCDMYIVMTGLFLLSSLGTLSTGLPFPKRRAGLG
jgi:hypothetical protein